MAIVKCSECGREVSDKAASCVGCGAPIGTTTPTAAAGSSTTAAGYVAMVPRQEEELYSERGVTITTARAIFAGRTYATANITSVAVRGIVEVPSKQGPIFLILVGALLFVFSLPSKLALLILIGLAMLVGGIAWLTQLKDKHTYRVFLGSASGEVEGLVSDDKEFIQKVGAALNIAIVKRG